MNESRLRYLLIAYVVLLIGCVIASFFSADSFSPELTAAYAGESEAWFDRNMEISIGLGAVFIVATVAGLVGLFLFRRWGRWLSLYSTAAALLLYPLMGPALYAPLEEGLNEIAALLWGAILAACYWSPLSGRFDVPGSSAPDALRAPA
ncbi:MAG: hypothetical protein ABWZ08_00715 [Pseudoxanthomonas sp.]